MEKVKVIETNLSIGELGEIKDHQSRIIEVDSWDEYSEEIKQAKTVDRNGTMFGVSIPKQAKIENLKVDNKHLSCDVYLYNNTLIKKLAYLI